MIDIKLNKGRLCALNVRKKSLAKFLEEQTQPTPCCTQLEAIHSTKDTRGGCTPLSGGGTTP